MMKGNRSILVFLFLIPILGRSQPFAWKSELNAAPQNNFYRIPLSLDWLLHVKINLSDVRIRDGQNQPVPFLVQQNQARQRTTFINFPILKNRADTGVTTLELDAGNSKGTSYIHLIIGNTAVERYASLSGSNDRKQWFIIDENLLLTNAAGSADDRFVQSLSFPFVRYRYLKLQIRNRGTDPLAVLKAGVYTDSLAAEKPEYYQHPGTTFQQIDSSDGNSYIRLRNPLPYPVDQIVLQLDGPKFYKRTVQIFDLSNEKKKAFLTSTELRSDNPPSVSLSNTKTQNLLLLVENGENPPLKIASVKTFTRQRQLVAYLEKGKQYWLLGGNADASFPAYDLGNFRDSIPSSPLFLNHGPVLANSSKVVASTGSKRWWLWPSIIFVLLLLSAVTFKMMKEMKKVEE